MILAAAIKFHIEKTNKDVVLCGHRHCNIFEQLQLLGFEPQKGYKEIEQGFIDDRNNFLTREEAYIHAIKCGQMIFCISDKKELELYSEDLW